MKNRELTFVSFEPKRDGFDGSLSVEGLVNSKSNPEKLLNEATKLYGRYIYNMRLLIKEIAGLRASRTPVPARKIWGLGNSIFNLKKNLAKASLQLDNLYGHLVRDLMVKRKWLEKVVIFRRYIANEKVIPKSVNWGQCEKGTRKAAENISRGNPPRLKK